MTTTTLREFTRLSMDTYDYPSLQIEEFGGIPQNTRYNYVSESFLNGLVNYGDNHVGFLLARYGIAVAHAPTDASKPHPLLKRRIKNTRTRHHGIRTSKRPAMTGSYTTRRARATSTYGTTAIAAPALSSDSRKMTCVLPAASTPWNHS
mgnify:CR=1 FL=1